MPQGVLCLVVDLVEYLINLGILRRNVTDPGMDSCHFSFLSQEGSSWHYNCTTYECVRTDEGATILHYSMVCPPFNETECKLVCTSFYLKKFCISCNLESSH